MAQEIIWKIQIEDQNLIVGSLQGAPKDAVLCFSMVAPARAVSGCKIIRAVGGYTELYFPDTQPENGFTFAFNEDRFTIHNTQWLPAKPYVRAPDGTCSDVRVAFDTPLKPLSPPREVPEFTGLRLVPQPNFWQPRDGFVNSAGFALATPHAAIAAVDALAKRNNLGPFLGDGLGLSISDDFTGAPEGYILDITSDGIEIVANSRAGVFYAAISLLNLHVNYGGRIPCGKITDAPRFGWRGQQLDCVRHFFQPDTIMRLLDLLALMKLNRFHWHFSDDEAFRLEVNCYPEIWQKTRMRGEGQLIPGIFGGGQGPTGGSYSLDFARDLVARAGELSIEVLPEIEIPAHAYCLNKVFPHLMDPAENSTAASVQGYIDNTMNPAVPFMWEFTENLLREIAEIFPFAHIHLGCDERPPEAWAKSSAAKALMADYGLETLDDLQGWTMDKVADFVTGLGCKPCAWEEAAKGDHGDIGKGAILFSWTGQGPGLTAARSGYQVVMTPAQHMYFDMSHSTSFDDFGARWAGIVSLENTVEWDPVPLDEPELEDNIIGVEGTFWGEFTLEDSDMERKIAPRILGLSETGWRAKDRRATAVSIYQMEQVYRPFFARIGWKSHFSAS